MKKLDPYMCGIDGVEWVCLAKIAWKDLLLKTKHFLITIQKFDKKQQKGINKYK